MRFAIALLAMLMISPAMAQHRRHAAQRPAPAAQPAAPETPLISGWTVSTRDFVGTFNTAATRLRMEDRAVLTGCVDGETPVFVCEFRIGATLPATITASEDRSTIKDITVMVDPALGNAGIIRLMSAYATLSLALEPDIPLTARREATRALFSAPAMRSGEASTTLGHTKFSLTMVPGLQLVLSAERAR